MPELVRDVSEAVKGEGVLDGDTETSKVPSEVAGEGSTDSDGEPDWEKLWEQYADDDDNDGGNGDEAVEDPLDRYEDMAEELTDPPRNVKPGGSGASKGGSVTKRDCKSSKESDPLLDAARSRVEKAVEKGLVKGYRVWIKRCLEVGEDGQHPPVALEREFDELEHIDVGKGKGEIGAKVTHGPTGLSQTFKKAPDYGQNESRAKAKLLQRLERELQTWKDLDDEALNVFDKLVKKS